MGNCLKCENELDEEIDYCSYCLEHHNFTQEWEDFNSLLIYLDFKTQDIDAYEIYFQNLKTPMESLKDFLEFVKQNTGKRYSFYEVE